MSSIRNQGLSRSRARRGNAPRTPAIFVAVLLVLLPYGWAGADESDGADAGSVRITTRVEPKSVTIGSAFRYVMRVEADAEVELMVPILAERIGDFIITDFGEAARGEEGEGEGIVVERWYDLVTYQPGEHLVPGPTVQFRLPGDDLQRIDADDVLIVVESLLARQEEQGAAVDLRDIKGPVAVPRDFRPFYWIAGALGLVCALVFLLYRILNRKRLERIALPRPPHEVALDALRRLRVARLLEEGRPEEYYVQLSSIVRAYLEGRFQLRAPEMTTEEFLQIAQRNPQMRPEQRSQLGRFLSEADLVKFARYVPSSEDGERAYAAAREFVEATAPESEVSRAAA